MQGVLHLAGPAVQQVFQRLPCVSPEQAPDIHFQHFTQVVWPRLQGSGSSGEASRARVQAHHELCQCKGPNDLQHWGAIYAHWAVS